jgi:peptidoglycan hydrolase-like protein with peptidoglycan-binding domain
MRCGKGAESSVVERNGARGLADALQSAAPGGTTMNRQTAVVGSFVCAAAVGLLLNVSTAEAQTDFGRRVEWASYGAQLTSGWQSNPVMQMFNDFSRPEVREAQRILQEHGYDPKATDGILWPWTREALVRCQRDHGVAVTGKVDAVTLEHLREMSRGAASPATER